MEVADDIIAFLQISGKAITYIQTTSGAEKTRQRLCDEIEACQRILLALKNNIDDSDETEDLMQSIKQLLGENGSVYRLHALLIALNNRLEKQGIGTDLKWPFQEKETTQFVDAIRRETHVMQNALANKSGRSLYELDEQIREANTRDEEVIARIEQINKRMGFDQALEVAHHPKASHELDVAPNDAYSDQPLDHTKQQFRLFTLSPSADPNAPLEGFLHVGDLDRPPAYEALSYAWGESASLSTLLLESGPRPISDNLFSAFHRLRHSSKPRILWVDVLCIDQDDVEERSHQVGMMASIYSSAQQVVIWLGEEKVDNRYELRSTKSVGEAQAEHCNQIAHLDRGRLENILERPWLNRIWIFNEALPNRHEPLIMCGADTIKLRVFVHALQSLVDNDYNPAGNIIASAETLVRARGYLSSIGQATDDSWNVQSHQSPESASEIAYSGGHSEEIWSDQSSMSDRVFSLETESTTNHEEPSLVGTTLIELQSRVAKHKRIQDTANDGGSLDYVSVVSNDEDIASRAPRRRSEPELLAVKLFGAFFAERAELHFLHRKLIDRLGVSSFVDNYRRSLKMYVLKLRFEARTALERDTVKVLERRENRQAIALQIMDHTIPDDEDTSKHFRNLADQKLQKQLLEDWADNVYGPPDLAPTLTELPDDYGEGGSDSDDDYPEISQLSALTSTNVDKACNFLKNNGPMQILLEQLWLLSFSPQLREILDSAPRDAIKISKENDTIGGSYTNHFKAFVEGWTMSQWDWWPLRQRIPMLAHGQLRLTWEFCGEPIHVEISQEDATTIGRLLRSAKGHPPRCHCCRPRPKRLDWFTAIERLCSTLKRYSPITVSGSAPTGSKSSSKAQARYMPTGTSSVNAPPHLQQATALQSPQNGALGSSVGTQTQTCTSSNPLWIVFGVKDIQGFYGIENIGTHVQCDDSSFFQELKSRHRKHRWFFQRWFSPYVFRYCRFVQYEEVLNEHISCVGEALPDEHGYTTDYEYSPRPPAAKKPLIDRAHFAALLRACDKPCSRSLLPKWIHKCRHIPDDRQYMSRIPQKKREYQCSTHVSHTDRVAFGIQAGYMPSFAVLFVYHAVLILSGFVFWIWWLKNHPSDLQNASVPLFTIGMLITAFWALFGKRMGTS